MLFEQHQALFAIVFIFIFIFVFVFVFVFVFGLSHEPFDVEVIRLIVVQLSILADDQHILNWKASGLQGLCDFVIEGNNHLRCRFHLRILQRFFPGLLPLKGIKKGQEFLLAGLCNFYSFCHVNSSSPMLKGNNGGCGHNAHIPRNHQQDAR